MSGKPNAPIIIKRKKVVGGDGHHGGAWKVAYADFVTAMMAFFMLMWLLNATTEKQRKGIADYFNPTIPVNRISGGGDGAFGGDSVFTDEELAQNGTGASFSHATSQDAAHGSVGLGDEGAERAAEDMAFEAIEEEFLGRAGESMVSQDAARHIITRVTDEGLIIEIFDLENQPLFRTGSARPTQIMTEIAGVLTEVFAIVENKVAIEGFVRSEPVVLANNPVWQLSFDRADEVRKLLLRTGFASERIQRIAGFGDHSPELENPMSVRNNRIRIVLLRSEHR